jgi:hypothetical protein
MASEAQRAARRAFMERYAPKTDIRPSGLRSIRWPMCTRRGRCLPRRSGAGAALRADFEGWHGEVMIEVR